MKQLTAKAFEHANVAGKKLQYIRITNGKKEVIINVGMKTFEGVTKLEQDDELPAETGTKQPPKNGK